ncbi:LuxR family transcriptional regulator [Telmatospirillum sp.]|uniref:response regulator transcription factor n=1 Tax=Telmatospirillum sp. TaxID=2079197 RepID=UPI00284D60F1|nr:LuxR family transcriptional regulator [Telmatospirillum sp.]MDR3439687.1 LuxR family transcriptional regulator [Telmatospirillum sp.]
MFLITQHFHTHARRPLWETSCGAGTPRRRHLLSARQLQVLDWIAKGKTNWEISGILEISPKSVEFHIECAKRQLQVFNRTHAVAKAIMLGMLPLRDCWPAEQS